MEHIYILHEWWTLVTQVNELKLNMFKIDQMISSFHVHPLPKHLKMWYLSSVHCFSKCQPHLSIYINQKPKWKSLYFYLLKSGIKSFLSYHLHISLNPLPFSISTNPFRCKWTSSYLELCNGFLTSLAIDVWPPFSSLSCGQGDIMMSPMLKPIGVFPLLVFSSKALYFLAISCW